MIEKQFFPYGQANFESIRRNEQFFVDNTAYIKEFERTNFQCFTRPPRWGKSLFTQILAFYYDKTTTPKQWDTLFGGLAIHKNPTELRGHFQVLKLDFSTSSDAGSVEKMNALLTWHINHQCQRFGAKYGYDVSESMQDAGDEVIEIIRLCDNEVLDTPEMSAQVAGYARRIKFLFAGGGACELGGTFAHFAVQLCKTGR